MPCGPEKSASSQKGRKLILKPEVQSGGARLDFGSDHKRWTPSHSQHWARPDVEAWPERKVARASARKRRAIGLKPKLHFALPLFSPAGCEKRRLAFPEASIGRLQRVAVGDDKR